NMEKYFKRKTPCTSTSDDVTKQATKEKPKQPIDVIDLNNLPWDPVDRPRISQYNVNQRDDIRRKYWNRGPCQPSGHDFKRTIIDDFGRQGGNEAFVTEGFNGWNKTERHDEKATTLYMGNFLELRKLIGKLDKNIGEVLKRTPKNCQLNSPQIQKEIADCFKDEVLQIIFKEIGDDVFSLLVDESSDVTKKEQMAIVLRYVNKSGVVKESLVGVVHVKETSSSYLKASIDSFFANHNLSLKQLRGQGYDGASNMRGEFNGLKAKILKENNSAYYVHCFAHQLQLVVVAVARKHLVVDMQIQEFNDRFSEASTELLRNMACLNPCDSFSQFNTSKLVRLSDLYPNDFDTVERMELESQLNLYYANVTKDDSFVDLNGITDLAIMMVKKRKHISYPLVYRLLKLALVLPVATASVERCFSAMKIIKSDLRNRIGQGFLNSCVICGVEREALANVNDEDVIKRFQNMTDRKGHL
ncbi:zinc finger MYM-type protein 1-like protein, partial [Tanacetum coccineum]